MSVDVLIRILALVVAAAALAFLVRYLWSYLFTTGYQPMPWRQQRRKGLVPEAVRIIEGEYPDKVRFFNLWFQIMRLEEQSVPGAFAELGVYKGDTARLLRHAAPGRLLYLFDTFSGFPASDLQGETGEAALYTTAHFADTSVEKVLRNIGSKENIIIRKGYFPDSAQGLEDESFALVSMDADLYRPTIEGLRFFYPRLAPGGIILVHDHDDRWPGIQQAIREYSLEIPETFIPLPDQHSTVMLVKNRRR